MLREYMQTALEMARYEIINDDEPYYGEVRELQGVWASGHSLEECRKNLEEIIEGWILVRVAKGLEVPSLRDRTIRLPQEMRVA